MTEQTKTPRCDSYADSVSDVEIVKHPIREFSGAMRVASQLETELATQSALLADMRSALAPFASEYEIADECGELQHWPESEVARCKAAYDALKRADDIGGA